MLLKVKKLNKNAILPLKATAGSACYDVYSVERKVFLPGEPALIRTGLAFALPEGYAMDIRPRSSWASKGLSISNSPGTLDSDYRGELMIPCRNLSSGAIVVNKGDRIAQIRLFKVISLEFEIVESLNNTKRGKGGFGSTGV